MLSTGCNSRRYGAKPIALFTSLTMAFRPIFVPDFLAGELASGDTLLAIRDRLQVKNWLTVYLVQEITDLFPTSVHINSITGERDQNVFSENCLKLFAPDRVFACDKQIEQAAGMFLDAWSILKAHDGKKIICHFGLSSKKKKPSLVDELQQRDHLTKKDQLKCPFKIMYSHQGRKANLKKPGIFYHAKITSVVTEHTCGMSPSNMRIALQKTGHLEVNIEEMKDILSLLSQKPRVACNVLRLMIENYLPGWKGTSAQYVNNFRKRVLLFLVQHPDYQHLSYDQACALSSKKVIASDELTGLDDPFVNQNFTQMLRKIMSNDSDTWEALSLMDDLKIQAPGFDYRIKKDAAGRPIGLMYMTAQMRYHARRYGSVLCLDAQKRQYNTSGWPYIAPVVKDNEMKVAVAAESIVTEETHEFYIWIIQSMASIEPHFLLSNIRIMFADQKLTTTILHELGIESSCILRGDFYHLLNEVWPDHFHTSVYPLVKKFLRMMLLSKTTEEWEDSYKCGRDVVVNSPQMLSALDKIYEDPEKYSGYYLRGIEGNLMMNGDVSAEQNHSGVVAYLGVGAAYSISEQMTHLLGRQRNVDKIRRQREDDQYVSGVRFESSFKTPEESADDRLAKKTFSGYGYTELWSRSIKRSFYLQSETTDEGSCVLWPTKHTKENRNEDSTTIILAGQRCPCERRIAFRIQCEHEYVSDGGIDIFKYNPQWFHRQVYDRSYPDMACVFTHAPRAFSETVINYDVNGDHENEFDGGGSIIDDNDNTEIELPAMDMEEDAPFLNENTTALYYPTSEHVSFQEIVARAKELASSCQQEQTKMRSLLSNINQMIDRVRDGKDIFIHFNDGAPLFGNNHTVPNINQPRPAVSKAISNATGVKRLQGHREFYSRKQSRHRKNVNLSQVSCSNDDDHLNAAVVRTRSCKLCQQKRHGIGNCPRVTKFGVVALQKGNEQVRLKLSSSLSNISRYALKNRLASDARCVYKELPPHREIKAIVLHSRFLITSHLHEVLTPENISIECTILVEFGSEHPIFTKQLFNVDCVAAHITRNKSNIILSQLDGSTTPNENDNVGPSVSEPSHAPVETGGVELSRLEMAQLSQLQDEMMLPIPAQPGYSQTGGLCQSQTEYI